MFTHEFTDGVQVPYEQWQREGKPEWTDHLVVEMSKKRAVDVAQRILAQLDNDNSVVCITLHGRLETSGEGVIKPPSDPQT